MPEIIYTNMWKRPNGIATNDMMCDNPDIVFERNGKGMHQDHFYEISETADGIFMIWEPAGVASILIVGTKAALLVDTGYGFANLKETVESITDLPYNIVNTHCHLDHAGGDYLFEQPVYIHPFERSVYEHYQRVQKPLAIDLYLRKFAPEELPWQKAFDKEAYLIYKEIPFIDLTDGQIFDCGDRTVKVIFLPGHTRGSIVLYDDKTQSLLAGDDISYSLWIQFDHSENLYAFAKHLDRLEEYPIRRIISSHSKAPWPPEMIGLLQQAIGAVTFAESTEFIHPRTGDKARTFRYPIPEINGKDKIYIVYDPGQI